jgi:hypothetical protein
MTNKNNFSKSQPDSNMYKCIISIEKSYKSSKHTNKLHILHKNAKKINILKMSYNKKWLVLLT